MFRVSCRVPFLFRVWLVTGGGGVSQWVLAWSWCSAKGTLVGSRGYSEVLGMRLGIRLGGRLGVGLSIKLDVRQDVGRGRLVVGAPMLNIRLGIGQGEGFQFLVFRPYPVCQ